jgi:hypothetical protein
MKTILPALLLLWGTNVLNAQITTRVIKAGFGVDGELRANYFNNIVQSGNDDWFTQNNGVGQFVIDTTGAAALLAQYTADPNSRKIPFYRTMRVDPYSLMNNFLVIDAVFIRDYHGDDSTIFASGSNKNGMSPANWSCPVAQSIPDKNEILDMMVHVRRAGPNATDSLWMFGGLSIENTTGNRYFDFEMYQTDIYYDRASLRFYGYGPDAGHTAWLFDASGNITKPGDIVFAAEYSSSTLSNIEARIWVHQSALSMTPTSFNWTGSFDGASSGAQYGYAGISPKTSGAFYTGLSSVSNTWAGPFSLVKGDNSVVTTYTAAQFMEFSVNLSKLGLDPVTLLGGDECGMPFRRVLVKSRSSLSFTAELKDFVGPFDLFLAPRASVDADIPYHCGTMGVSQLEVVNPVSTSVYTWSTPDGNIVSGANGTIATVNYPGTYILRQQLQSGCSTYATDTITITHDPSCILLPQRLLDFRGNIDRATAKLNWNITKETDVKYFELEKSDEGLKFTTVQKIVPENGTNTFNTTDNVSKHYSPYIYYRVKFVTTDNLYGYSRVLRLNLAEVTSTSVTFSPNPVKDGIQLYINSLEASPVQIDIYSIEGRLMKNVKTNILKGYSSVSIAGADKWPAGIYAVKAQIGNEIFSDRIVIIK